jgi:hypothetical protein
VPPSLLCRFIPPGIILQVALAFTVIIPVFVNVLHTNKPGELVPLVIFKVLASLLVTLPDTFIVSFEVIIVFAGVREPPPLIIISALLP